MTPNTYKLIIGLLLLISCLSCSTNEPKTTKENKDFIESFPTGKPIEVQEPTITSYESTIDSTVFILEVHPDFIKSKLNNDSQKVNLEQLKVYIEINKRSIKVKEILLVLKKGASYEQSVGIVRFLKDSGFNKLSVVGM
jgi:biopolymer transport protein ExbD